MFNIDTDVSQIDDQVAFSADENIKFKFPANPNSPEDIVSSINGFADSMNSTDLRKLGRNGHSVLPLHLSSSAAPMSIQVSSLILKRVRF